MIAKSSSGYPLAPPAPKVEKLKLWLTGYRGEDEAQRRWVDASSVEEVDLDRLADGTCVTLRFNGGRATRYHFDEPSGAEAFARDIRGGVAVSETVQEAQRCFIQSCDYTDIDQRGPVWISGDTTPHHACTEHWEAIYSILARQVGSDDEHRPVAPPADKHENAPDFVPQESKPE